LTDLLQPTAMVVTLMRTSITRERAGAVSGCSQVTVSRRRNLIRPVPGTVLAEFVLTPPQVAGRKATLLADGTIAPTWGWKAVPDLFSGQSRLPGHDGRPNPSRGLHDYT
jgi:hypothetical protein